MSTAIRQVPPVAVISQRIRLTIPQIAQQSWPVAQAFDKLLKTQGVSPAGAMIYVYHDFCGDPNVPFYLEICLPVNAGLTPTPPIELKTLPAFQCITLDHAGPMTTIGQSWMKLIDAVKTAGRQPTGESREIYRKWVSFDSADNLTELQQGVL